MTLGYVENGTPTENRITDEDMSAQQNHTKQIALIVAATFLTISSGCVDLSGGGAVIDGNRDSSLTIPNGKTSGEPNGSFAEAIVAVFQDTGAAALQGTVARVGDLDVYDLGPLAPGDRVTVDVRTTGSNLDVSIALFDDAERLVYANDDRGGSTSRFLDSFVDFTTRHGGGHYYLVVTQSAFADSGDLVGTYEVDVDVVPGGDVPPPVGQTLILDFDGSSIDSPVLGTFSLEPFDAGRIGPAYEGMTDTVIEWIVTVMDQNFERFDVTVLTTNDPPPPSGTMVSTIFFGGFNAQAFGLSESVDLYNADFCDDAVIYAESFSPSVFSFQPTAAQLGVAIGNVATHEAGHLLGLNHTDDDRDLMDDRSSADVFVSDQEFMEAALSSDIMSIGTQDGVLLLQETVGLFGEN